MTDKKPHLKSKPPLPDGETCFKFRYLHEIESLAGSITKQFSSSMHVELGLTELMINALEHGNLNISYEDKRALNKENGAWEKEINRRLNLSENAGKYVELRVITSGNKVQFVLRDMGKGFDWKKFMDFDKDRISHTSGRGIALAKALSFSSLEYRRGGSEVVATIYY
ncbi:MAG: ATP-binding protein [Magnetococcales bacterium]|nr:ATP-binding protein [Magnetococcales bacterium]